MYKLTIKKNVYWNRTKQDCPGRRFADYLFALNGNEYQTYDELLSVICAIQQLAGMSRYRKSEPNRDQYAKHLRELIKWGNIKEETE